jgi:hypothetical protein
MKNHIRIIIPVLLLLSSYVYSYAQSLYDINTVQTIEIYFSNNNWDQLLDNAYATTGDYIMADSVIINGTKYDSVGVKYKGNSSYNANQVKNPWHIELDTYKDQDYQGYKDIKLANGYKDPSFLRDVLGYQIARQYMDAPLANYAMVYVNNTLIGLYSNTEAINKTFVKSRFGSKKNTFFSCSPPDGASPTSGDYPNLVYLGQDSSLYYNAYEIKSDYGWKDLINLCDTLNNYTSNIEEILDVDRALWMLAFDNAIVNLDSYIGQFSQNYYLYKDDFGRFLSVVWDLNESFGTFSSTGTGNLNSTTDKQQMDYLLHSNDANWPLVSQLLSVPTYKKMYLAHLKTILTENFTPNGPYYTMAQNLQNTIDSYVQADQNKFFTYNDFLNNFSNDVVSGPPGPGGNNIPGIANIMDARYTYLMAQNEFSAIQPNISNVYVANTPILGNYVTIRATVTNHDSLYLGFRSQNGAPFTKIKMYDDGNHNDGVANDNIFGADILINSSITQYYIYAENNTIGMFSPERAEHEFYTITVTGNITPGDIVINEFMASNDTTVADQDSEYDDWIELYNNSTNTIDISGYSLSDDLTNLQLFTFPTGTVMPPNSYIIVWADKDLTQSGYHADFKLSASGESIYLTDSTQTILDSVSFGQQTTDVSYGRYPNGTGPFQAMPATFSAENHDYQSTAIAENPIGNSNTLSIFPNPATDVIYISIKQNLYFNNPLKIFNQLGEMVYSSMLNDNLTSINVSNWANGLYFVQHNNNVYKLLIAK